MKKTEISKQKLYDRMLRLLKNLLGCNSHPPPWYNYKFLKPGFIREDMMYNFGEDIEDFTEEFMRQFIQNGSAVPAETLLIQTESMKRITEQVQRNETFCFKTEPGQFGWCATCQVEKSLTLS